MIDFELFVQWAESRFGDIKISGNEVKVNSPFCEDYKHHLWCNPTGGKNGYANGVYRCWKTDKRGSLVSLVMEVDHCEYDHAISILGGDDYSLADLEQKVDELFARIYNLPTPTIVTPPDALELPPSTFKICDLDEGNIWRMEAENYLLSRCLPIKDFLICTEGDYQNRIIIPYRDKDRRLIYWNGRLLYDSKYLAKYMGPQNVGIGKSDVIYMADGWPDEGKLHITEGEFDAKSLAMSGFYAGALGGKEIYEKQIEMIKKYHVVLCFDTDAKKKIDAGGNAIITVAEKLLANGFERRVSFVRPPIQFKDWNEMLIALGNKIVKAYILSNEKIFTETTKEELLLNRIVVR